jgi:hypothetical protein
MKHYFLIFLACLLQTATAFSPAPSNLPADQVQDFEEATEVYLSSFQKYLGEIAKTNDATKANKLFAHVQDMFVDANQTIEVGWIFNGVLSKQKYTVRQYLERLQNRKTVYSRVEISEHQKASQISAFAKTRTKDVFRAEYLYNQTFRGYQNAKGKESLLYGDKTSKKVEIFADKRKPNETQVKLGNISVDKITLLSRSAKASTNAENRDTENATEDNQTNTILNRQETLLQKVSNLKPKTVRLVGKKGNTTRVLTLAQFTEKYEFGEFNRYAFKENKNNEVIIQLK